MSTALTQEQIRDMLNRGMEMSFPPVVVQLVRALLDPTSDVRQICRILGLDPLLSAAIIRMANTPYFGGGSSVATLEQAAMILGTREILKLALSVSIKKSLCKNIPMPQERFFHAWRTIIWSSMVGEKLCLASKAASPELGYLSLLLKDISLFLLYEEDSPFPWICPSEYDPADDALEMERWGNTHAQISGQLASSWSLPQEVTDAIIWHHQDPQSSIPGQALSPIVAMATRWSELLHCAAPEVEKLIQLEMSISNLLGISPAVVQSIREESITDFKGRLELLEIPEAPVDERFYELPLETIKIFYFLSLELVDTGHDLIDLANIIGRHLDLYWQITDWHLYLQVPKRKRYMLFSHSQGNGGGICQQGPFSSAEARQHPGQLFFTLTGSNATLGELHLPEEFLHVNNETNFRNYLRMISQALNSYYQHQATLKSQASLLRDLPVGVARLDSTGLLLEGNKMLRKNLNIDAQLGDISLLDILTARAGDIIADSWEKITAPDGPEHVSAIVNFQKCPDSDACPCAEQIWVLAMHRWGEMDQDEVLVVLEDITELSELETQTLQQRDFLENLFQVMQEIVMTIDGTGRITWVAPPNQHLRDKNFFEICRPTPITHIWGPHLLNDKGSLGQPVEVGIKISEQRLGLFEFVFAPLKAEDSYLLVGRDLTNIRRLAAQIKRQAFNDGLTGLFNHGHFHTLLSAQVSLQKQKGFPLGLLFMDLDKFKAVNDNEGHSAGDNILKIVAQILLSEIRQGNDYACRYGGDEFAVIVPGITPEGLEIMARRIVEQVPQACRNQVSASMGLALLGNNETVAEFLDRADRAVYSVKHNGGNGFAWG